MRRDDRLAVPLRVAALRALRRALNRGCASKTLPCGLS